MSETASTFSSAEILFWLCVTLLAFAGIVLLMIDIWLYQAPWRKSPRCPKCHYDLSDQNGLQRARQRKQPHDFNGLNCPECGEAIVHYRHAYHMKRHWAWIALRTCLGAALISPSIAIIAIYAGHRNDRQIAETLRSHGAIGVPMVNPAHYQHLYLERPLHTLLKRNMLPPSMRRMLLRTFSLTLSDNKPKPMHLVNRLKHVERIIIQDFLPPNADELFTLPSIKYAMIYNLKAFDLRILDRCHCIKVRFEAIEQFTHQTHNRTILDLTLADCAIQTFAQFDIPNLEEIFLDENKGHIDFKDRVFPRCTYLTLSDSPFKNLDGLEAFKSLVFLEIDYRSDATMPSLLDVQPLANLPALSDLSMDMPELTEVRHLNQLTRLRQLTINASIQNLSDVKALPQLLELRIPADDINRPEVKHLRSKAGLKVSIF